MSITYLKLLFLSVFILRPAMMWMQYLLLFMEDGQQSLLT